TAFFVHPAEASHGDMGMITRDDVVLALSNSGSTAEIVTLLPLIKRLGITLISMTGNPESALAKAAEVNLDARVSQEACPLNLAPTSSTTVSLVLGDALAIALLEARGFTAEDFAFSHPGGALGRRLLLKVENVMHAGATLPKVQRGTSLRDALLEMTQKGLGMTVVVEDDGRLAGVFTDGDLRRTLDRGIDVRQASIDEVMTVHGKTARAEMLAAEALKIMEDHKISGLVVVDSEDRPVGALNMHDLLRAGVM
ncbi:KpsF/GutQ family sugar-phosphate isomerase, partial [Pseudomonas sp.]|uniref:KpsF/GutQ family sugar-phosphate isomerase n=1 Tax=Pseudomonas sp. TaxID=306 RepID=UPI0027366B0C